jgi:hypothetical protein
LFRRAAQSAEFPSRGISHDPWPLRAATTSRAPQFLWLLLSIHSSPFKVVFGLSPNMGVAPSGVEKENVGHHHLLVDKALTPEEMTQPIMVDEQHIHFGKGQTETTLTLPPGKHTLQLILGDWTHIPFMPPVQSEIITVTVKAATAAKPAATAIAKKPQVTHHHRKHHYHHRKHHRHHHRHKHHHHG